MLPKEYTRIVHYEKTKYAEFYFQRGELGAPYYVWWDLRMCKFKYEQLKAIPGSDIFLNAIKDLQ